jgi:hypothetical protein
LKNVGVKLSKEDLCVNNDLFTLNKDVMNYLKTGSKGFTDILSLLIFDMFKETFVNMIFTISIAENYKYCKKTLEFVKCINKINL